MRQWAMGSSDPSGHSKLIAGTARPLDARIQGTTRQPGAVPGFRPDGLAAPIHYAERFGNFTTSPFLRSPPFIAAAICPAIRFAAACTGLSLRCA